MEFIDEQNDILHLANFIHDRLDAFLKLTTVFRACDHQGEVESDHTFVAQDFWNIAGGDFLGEAFSDGGLADTGFANQNWVIFGAAAEDLDDAFDFAFASDDRIQFAVAGTFREVASKRFQRRSFGFALGSFTGICARLRVIGELAIVLIRFVHVHVIRLVIRCVIRVDFREDFIASRLDIDFQLFEDAGGDAISFAEEAEKQMLRADVRVIESLRFLIGESEDLLHAGSVGDIACALARCARADFLFHLHADTIEIQSHAFEDIDGDTLAEFDEAEQDVLSADIIVAKAIGFLTGER